MRKKSSQKTGKSSSPSVLMIVSLLVFFLLGATVMSYPLIAEWWNNNHQQKAASGYQNVMETIQEEDYYEYYSAARTYNQHLLSAGTILTDPFDFKTISDSAGEYENMLNYDEIMATIEIPEIDVFLPIYHGTAEDTLAKGIGHLAGTSLPIGGVGSHCVLTGHTGLPGKKLFTDISKLGIDDIFYINIMKEKLLYQVDNIEVILPEEIDRLVLVDNEDYVTLVTCTPYGVNDHRLLVRGTRIYPDQLTPEEMKKIEQSTETKKSLSKIEIAEIIGAAVAGILFIIMIVLAISMIKQRKKNGDKKGNEGQ